METYYDKRRNDLIDKIRKECGGYAPFDRGMQELLIYLEVREVETFFKQVCTDENARAVWLDYLSYANENERGGPENFSFLEYAREIIAKADIEIVAKK